jgi:hypothetical protein
MINKKRFFSFGCSFTKYWENPTWADYIGIEFDNFYNLAMPGSSNNLIMQRFIESDSYYNFNSETDVIMIAISGLGRYSFPLTINDKDFIYSRGDLDGDLSSVFDTEEVCENVKFLRTKFWKKRYGVFDSYISIKIMKDILSARNITHKIFAGLDYKIYMENTDVYGINEQLLSKLKLIESMLDFKESLSEFDNFNMHHPSQQTHYNFAKKYFSEFLGEKSLDLFNNDYNKKYREYIDKIIPDYHGLGLYDTTVRDNFYFEYF